MAYRFDNTPPPKPELLVPKIDVRNGGTTIVAFPCFYLEMEKPVDWHDHHVHDHIGWPSPNHPDHICQKLPDYTKPPYFNGVYGYVDMDKVTPIHLIEEGYTQAILRMDSMDTAEKVSSSSVNHRAYISEDEDWVVKIEFNPMLAEFKDKPIDFLFSLFVYSPESMDGSSTTIGTYDEVVRAMLTVLPGNSIV